MAVDSHKQFLAAKVLTDGLPISYREFSREFKIHVNEAKESLSSFHRYQSRMKPGSIHATYLLTGLRKSAVKADLTNGSHAAKLEDEPMQSSPFNNVADDSDEESEDQVERVVTIVGEEHLDSAKVGLEEGYSFHIYSIEPGALNDLQVLTECNRRVAQMAQDSSKAGSFGTIHNPDVKRRDIKISNISQDPLSKPPPPKPSVKKAENTATDGEDVPAASQASVNSNKSTSRPTTAAGKPSLKKENSNIFKSFAKAKPKAKKEAEKDQPGETVKFDSDASNGDDDDDPVVAPSSKRQTKEDRDKVHENLKKMWDNDKEDESMDSNPDGEDEEPEDEPIEEDDEPEPSTEKPQKAPEPPAQETRVQVSGGRRRGKRTVMKPKTFTDEEGFIHTKKVPVEEDFSEEDVPAPAPSRPKVSSQQPSAANKPKTAAPKSGRGDISSFFKKKT